MNLSCVAFSADATPVHGRFASTISTTTVAPGRRRPDEVQPRAYYPTIDIDPGGYTGRSSFGLFVVTDTGDYYMWVSDDEAKSRMHVDSWRESFETLQECSDELSLTDLPLWLKWFRPAFNARESYLAGDPLYFAGKPLLGGEVAWNHALSSGCIEVNCDLELSTPRIIAHEIFHIAQMRRMCCDPPTGSLLAEVERLAWDYADSVYTRVRIRRFPLSNPQ